MRGRVLHLLSQRPGQTGSGVFLAGLVEQAARAGWTQCAVVGLPAALPTPELAGLPAAALRPLRFETEALDFPLPGMSDVMPYPSSRFSALSPEQLARYEAAWSEHLGQVIAEFQPDLLHSHHVWLLSALLKDLAPTLPVLTSCHATGLRQATLCPHLAARVRAGCRRNERFLVLHAGQARELAAWLDLPPSRIRVCGPGYREECFHARERDPAPGPELLYVGKYSNAKGLPQLLDALPEIRRRHPGLRLHLAGGSGGEAGAGLAERAAAIPGLIQHGALDQSALAALMRQVAVLVLPSFYEGLPLVLVEAAACGCRLVSTALPGVVEALKPGLGAALTLVPLPSMEGVDRPAAAGLPAFVARLAAALGDALAAGPLAAPPALCLDLGWPAVFGRVEAAWRELLAEG